MYYLQSRWCHEGNNLIYYGIRNKNFLFNNKTRLSKKQSKIISSLPAKLSEGDISALKNLVGVQIVKEEDLRRIPKSINEAVFCKGCAANDYIIPGIEFQDGLCPMCQTKEGTKELKSIVPIKNTFPTSKRSRFDIALFYTGGKDSTYLLYYLSKVLSLRVLALTWEIPFMSQNAKKSIENAKNKLTNVEFICRKISDSDLRKIYTRLYELSGNTCACPSLAYVLFYHELTASKVPYFIAGNEPAQIVGLYYNGMAPKIAYSFSKSKLLNLAVNVGRILTLRPPLKDGQFHTLTTMKQLAYGDSFIKKLIGYRNPLVTNVTAAIHTVPAILKPLKKAIRSSSASGNIPAFVQVDLDAISGGKYDWRKIKDIIVNECGWVAPAENDKALHTSCSIEKCKEHTQFVRFYNMQSKMIPFSALEISLASRDGSISRSDAIAEMNSSLGFSFSEPNECAVMKEYIGI